MWIYSYEFFRDILNATIDTDEKTNQACTFKLHTSRRVYILKADSRNEVESWGSALNAHKKFLLHGSQQKIVSKLKSIQSDDEDDEEKEKRLFEFHRGYSSTKSAPLAPRRIIKAYSTNSSASVNIKLLPKVFDSPRSSEETNRKETKKENIPDKLSLPVLQHRESEPASPKEDFKELAARLQTPIASRETTSDHPKNDLKAVITRKPTLPAGERTSYETSGDPLRKPEFSRKQTHDLKSGKPLSTVDIASRPDLWRRDTTATEPAVD